MRKIFELLKNKSKVCPVAKQREEKPNNQVFDFSRPYRFEYNDDYTYTEEHLTAQEAYERDLQDYEESKKSHGEKQCCFDLREINMMIEDIYDCVVKINLSPKDIKAFIYGTAMGANVDSEFADYVYDEIVKRIRADMHEEGKDVVKKEQTVYEFSQK